MIQRLITTHLALVLLALPVALAQSSPRTDRTPDASSEIEAALKNYIAGTALNDPELTLSAFYPEADLFLSHPERPLWIVPIQDYAERLGRGVKGESNGRTGKVLSIEQHGDIATASAEIVLPDGRRFIDLFLMKRLDGQWKILSKAATQVN